jgi:hypothetical protein
MECLLHPTFGTLRLKNQNKRKEVVFFINDLCPKMYVSITNTKGEEKCVNC